MKIKAHKVMGDTAKLLDVKTPFVSAAENGTRKVSNEWISIVVEHYKLNE